MMNSFQIKYKTLSNEKLLTILRYKNFYHELAVDAAKKELINRNVIALEPETIKSGNLFNFEVWDLSKSLNILKTLLALSLPFLR